MLSKWIVFEKYLDLYPNNEDQMIHYCQICNDPKQEIPRGNHISSLVTSPKNNMKNQQQTNVTSNAKLTAFNFNNHNNNDETIKKKENLSLNQKDSISKATLKYHNNQNNNSQNQQKENISQQRSNIQSKKTDSQQIHIQQILGSPFKVSNPLQSNKSSLKSQISEKKQKNKVNLIPEYNPQCLSILQKLNEGNTLLQKSFIENNVILSSISANIYVPYITQPRLENSLILNDEEDIMRINIKTLGEKIQQIKTQK